MDLKLIGDDEEQYTERSGMMLNGESRMFYFEGSSFDIPESMTLTGSRARAVDKDRLELVVDTEKLAVVEAPDDRISLQQVTDRGKWLELRFLLQGIDPEDNMLYSVLEGTFADSSGASYRTGNGHTYGDHGTDGQYVAVQIPDEAYAQPLSFRISNYPAYIGEPFEIRIR